jgi:subtilisin family serine protease
VDAVVERSLGLVRLNGLMAGQSGRPDVVVAVIDGPAQTGHPDLAGASIEVLPGGPAGPGGAACRVPDSVACRHGTFVLGMLCARRGTDAPGICPGCTMLLYPVLAEAPASLEAGPADLAAAVLACVDRGARIINLSLGVRGTALTRSKDFDDAVDHAMRRGVLVVAAAGNHGLVGPAPLVSHPWLIPVAACDWTGRMLRMSNLGIGVGRTGLAAPGRSVLSTAPGGYQRTSGTSVAAPFVTGTAALLWSAYPAASAPQLRAALLRSDERRRSVVPPLLDASASLTRLAPARAPH